ncbi:DUF6522 family protein [Chelatococcus asaccharovorans]|uniref:DUF6522 family protein n=1 Tax=Chelatococcus asaccharovorans TaxID=28210 RepID=UPI00224C659D|nr:DUF6522 family protein [Chelatococcus asaccharovorans]CAH1661415.1 hypothetical protein CHELA17_50093 [Chelatococcus asaccharovorans]CAH1689778.1 hypothetical protein CHELA40_40101 [Chelatococcus asaccharovorans]
MIVQAPSRPPDVADLPFLLDGALVAQRFGVTVTRMRELMRRRMVQSRVEKGEGEDAGHWRITLRLGNRVWRGVFTDDGQLSDETSGLAGR